MKMIAVIVLSLCSLSFAANDPTTQPVTILNAAPGTIIENRNIIWQPGMDPDHGIYVNGSKNLIIRNCRIDGFRMNICLVGGNPGAQIYQNIVVNSTSGSTVDSSGVYTEGLSGYSIHDNIVANNGWWKGYDPNDPLQRTIANRHHGWYNNESYGTADNGQCFNNIFVDNCGSNIGSRKGGIFTGNVFRPSGDWDLIFASLGGNGVVTENAFFGPKVDAVPNYGGGIHMIGTGLCVNNYFAGSAAITYNPACIDNANNVIPQRGYWPKPGAGEVVQPGTPALTLEAYYHSSNPIPLMRLGDAQKIVEWVKVSTK